MNAVQSRLLAATGAVALCFVPVAAQANTPVAAVVHSQDDTDATAAPEDEGGDTEGDDAEVTSPAVEEESDGEGEAADPTDAPAAETDDAETAEENNDDESIPADDPAFWVDFLTDEGFSGVECFIDFGDEPTYPLTEQPDAGTDWLLLVALSEVEGGIFDVFDEPLVGDVFSLETEDGVQVNLSAVIVCQADLEASDADPGTAVDGIDSDGSGVSVSTPGPKVETDVPVTGSDSGLGAIVGLSALLMGAGGVVLSRRVASRR